MKIYLRLEAPFEWVRVDESKSGIANGESRVDSFGEVQGLDQYPISEGDDDVVGVVPGEWVTMHVVDLPAKSKKIFSAALPYALEEAISEDVENMHFIAPSWKAGESCGVLAVAKSKMGQWKDLATQYQLPIAHLVPDHALLPLHESADCSIVLDGDMVYAKRDDDFGVTLDKGFLDAWIMDVPVDRTIAVNEKGLTEALIAENPSRDIRFWEVGSKLVHWLDYPTPLAFDLWGDKYRPSIRRSGGNPYFLAMLVLLFVVIGKLGFDTYQYIALRSEMAAIKQETQTAFKSALPEFGDAEQGQERSLMEKVLSRSGSEDKSVNLQELLAIIARVLTNQNVSLSDFNYKEDELIITCQLSDFSQVDSLTKQLNASGRLSAELQSSETDEGKVIASYLITPNK